MPETGPVTGPVGGLRRPPEMIDSSEMSGGYLLGIDGGGTKTVCLLADENLKVLGRGIGGPSNYLSEGIYTAKMSLRAAVQEALAAAGVDASSVGAVCAGLAGASRPRDRQTMQKALREIVPAARIRVEIDAFIALAGATECRPGVIVISGTGSVAFGVNSAGETARSGGWGFVAGDEGSGFDIGRKGIAEALRHYDGRAGITTIAEKLMREMYLESLEEMIPILYSGPFSPAKIASLFPLILEAAREGDQAADRLIREAAGELSRMAAAVVRRLKMEEHCLVATSGGVFRSDQVRGPFAEHLRRAIPGVELIPAAKSAEMGALFAARAALREETLFQSA